MTFFGQFFDHGLDLVPRAATSTVFIPLQPDDPLFNVAGGATNFMVVTRATQTMTPGPMACSAPQTTCTRTSTRPRRSSTRTRPIRRIPRTRCSCASTRLEPTASRYATGKLITNRDLGADGKFGGGDDTDLSGMATWGW